MSGSPHELRPTWSRSDRRIPRVVLRPMQEFLETSTSSALLLFAAVVVALVWANLGSGYEAFWHTPLELQVGDTVIGEDLHFWVNDGLMTIFFFLVGLEIKRELTTGELTDPRAAALPAIAALGGMVVPAAIYLVIAGRGDASSGWAIPMATDIALALGALALAARHAPPGLKPLLLTLAIVDDIGAILVIALFYSGGLSLVWLEASAGVLLAILVAQRIGIRATWVYWTLGAVLWFELYRAGLHPTLAGVILGLITPAVPFQGSEAVSREARRIADETTEEVPVRDEDARAWIRLSALSHEAVSPLARLEHELLPWSSFVIVPIFALANGGVLLSGSAVVDAVTGPVGLGVFLGLVVGKPLGIWLASLIAVRSGVATLPSGVSLTHVGLMGVVAGIGFTVSLFIAELAFPGSPLLDDAKIAILAASFVAGSVGIVLMRMRPAATASVPADELPGAPTTGEPATG
jgi:NhaA family Na+:H+ antiporter